MIALTRLNGSTFYLNPDLLWLVETTPDTVLTMANGERLVVAEAASTVVDRFEAFKHRINQGASVTQHDLRQNK
jgi:flagellar protein FlbD